MNGAAAERVAENQGSERRFASAGLIASVMAWCALAAGLAQGAITAFNRFVLGRIVYASRDVYWMAPLSYVMVFALGGLGLWLISAVVPRPARAVAVTVVGLWGAFFSLTLPYANIARWASAIFTLGLAVMIGRGLAADADRWHRRARSQALAMGMLVCVLGVGTRTARVGQTARSLAALPAPEPATPNVLLIILDTVRSASMHLYGFERQNTPRLDSLSRSSLVFDNAFGTAPWTLPSHASMFTGSYPELLNANYVRPLSPAERTLAELLASRGYETAGFVANHHYTGYDTGLARGFSRYEDYKVSFQQVLRTSWLVQAFFFYRPKAFGANVTIAQGDVERVLQVPPKTWADAKRAQEVVDEFLNWESKRPKRPFFAFLNMYDAHDPRYAPSEIKEKFVSRYPNRDWYDAAIAYMDREVGRAVDSLQVRGVLDNTVIIVASDHGELFGSHGLWGHANSLYLDVLRVPLLIRYPARVPSGARVTRPVSLRDLAATVTDLAGVPERQRPGGASLLSVASGSPDSLSPVLSFAHRTINLPRKFPAARGDMYSVILDSLHLIKNLGDGEEQLFNFVADGMEQKDLAREPDRAEDLQRLRALRARSVAIGGRR